MRGDRLHSLRLARGESRQELADAVGVTRVAIRNYEMGKREPEALILLRMSQHYGVSSEYLMGLTDDPIRETNLPPDWEQAVRKAMKEGFRPTEIEQAVQLLRTVKREGI